MVATGLYATPKIQWDRAAGRGRPFFYFAYGASVTEVVIDTLIEQGLRDDYIVLVGGAPLNEEFGKAIGADAYCRDAAVAVETAKDFIARKHNLLSA